MSLETGNHLSSEWPAIGALLKTGQPILPSDQLHVIKCWLRNMGFEQAASERGLTDDQAHKLLRAAVATLRRRFGPKEHQSKFVRDELRVLTVSY